MKSFEFFRQLAKKAVAKVGDLTAPAAVQETELMLAEGGRMSRQVNWAKRIVPLTGRAGAWSRPHQGAREMARRVRQMTPDWLNV